MKPQESSSMSTDTLPSSDSDTEEFESTDEGQPIRNRSLPICRRGRRIRGSSRARSVRGGSMRGHARVHGSTRARSVRGGRQTRQTSQNQLLLEGPWKKEESNSLIFPYQGSEPGPTTSIDTCTSVADIFSRFFTDNVWGLLVSETNKYAAHCRQQSS